MTTLTTPTSAPARSPRARPLRAPVRRTWWPDAVGVVVWFSALVVVALWVSNGGVQNLFAGAGDSILSLGRLTGLVSSDMLLLQVLSMARIPWVERALGQDAISRWHRLLGFTSVNLLLAHAVLTTLAYAMLGRLPFLSELWSLVTTAPGMLLATAGTALFVMIMVTSIRAARRRMRYESWHLLHLYAYLGAGLALPHQLWTGADFLASPVATAYWWGLYAFALASVLVFRVAMPWRLSRQQNLVVSKVVTEAPDVVSIHLTGKHLARMPVAAGQFFVWRFRTGPGWTRGHPLSLSAAPTTAGLRVTSSTQGDDGDRLARMKPGTRVLIEGPYGRLTPDVRTQPRLAVIGSGLGLAPLISVLQATVANPGTTEWPVTVIRRFHAAGPQPLQAELDALVASRAVKVLDLVGPRSTAGTTWLPAHLGHVPGPEALTRLIPDLDRTDVYVCGAAPWAEAVGADARAAGVGSHALHVERFSW